MANFMDFSSDRANVFLMLIDESGSMADDELKVKEGMRQYRKSFENFSEANSIAVSVCKFNEDFKKQEFKAITKFGFDYDATGGTALYYSIIEGANHLKNYIKEVTEVKGIVPRATFIVFSDGEPCYDKRTKAEAMEAIAELNYSGVTTVFVAFGSAIKSSFGEGMGFMSTIDVDNREVLVNFLGVELSKSCKEQSKSMKSLGANFFSKAVGKTASEAFSKTTQQALEDTSWIDDI